MKVGLDRFHVLRGTELEIPCQGYQAWGRGFEASSSSAKEQNVKTCAWVCRGVLGDHDLLSA